MNQPKLLLTLLLSSFAIAGSVFAQSKSDFLKTADRYYEQGNSYAAAVYYEKYLQVSSKDDNKDGFKPYFTNKNNTVSTANVPAAGKKKVMYQLAESYRSLNDYTNAERWYKELIQEGAGDEYPLAEYWYGVSLRANKKPQEAGSAFQTFLTGYKENDNYSAKAKMEVESLPFAEAQATRNDVASYKINEAAINAKGATYASSVTGSSLYFSSTRPDTTVKTPPDESPYINNIYRAEYTNGTFGTAQKLGINHPKGFEQGTTAISADGNTLFFTRWQKVNKDNVSAIYSSHLNGDSWSDPVKLTTEVNVDGSSSKEPFITPDGKLLFSSNKPGGKGGFDLWEIPVDSNGVVSGVARNLGSEVNTTQDEVSPFYHSASKTLVFASNGRIGMGGFDLYTTKADENGEWKTPSNPGYPVNSVKDDLYFTTNSNTGLFKQAFISSDRNSPCCLQLFSLDKEYKKLAKGSVVDCKTNLPIADALVQVTDSSKGRVLNTQLSDPSGSYVFDLTNNTRTVKFEAEKKGYKSGSVGQTKMNEETDTTMNAVICLMPIEDTVTPNPPMAMLLHFDFNKSNIRSDANIVLDSLAAVMKRVPGLFVEIGAYTDGKGEEDYNQNLSEERAASCFNYLVNVKGIDAKRFKKKGYGECCKVGKEFTEDGKDNPEGRQLNRRAEFKIVGF